MKTTHAAMLAVATLAVGVIAGRMDWHLGSSPADAPASDTQANLALPEGHPMIPVSGGLDEAVRNTVRAGSAPGPMPPAATSGNPIDMLVAQAETLRRQRKFNEAADVYRKIIAQQAMNADMWADYADALASATSSLQGEPAKALDRALALDPKHAKALWLKASLEHEQHQYAAAIKTWQQLLAVVPPDSSDAKIIRANIDEASRLSSKKS